MKHTTKLIKLKSEIVAEKTMAEMPDKNDLPALAKWLELAQRFDEAAKIYEKLLEKEPYREFNYNRLMIIYRRKKEFKNELRVIKAGIKSFENFYRPSGIGKHKSIIALSKKLNVLIGLTDKKGKNLADTEPIGKWKKRKEIVERKLGRKL